MLKNVVVFVPRGFGILLFLFLVMRQLELQLLQHLLVAREVPLDTVSALLLLTNHGQQGWGEEVPGDGLCRRMIHLQ